MNKLKTLKIFGAFIFVLAIATLVLAITDVFNNAEYINEYNTCINQANYSPELIDQCRENASKEFHFTIRKNQLEITTMQYINIFTKSIVKV